eukprot:Sspe_Gene.17252::Locus_6123_Transcript_1_1_Confidence_1.000_Length_1438::g.17252::m.17252/K14950/ATP13A1, SPF1; manganese-transporting P-type ATPase
MELRHPPSLAKCTVYKPDPTRRLLLTALLVALYGFALQWAWETAGEPYHAALEEASRLENVVAVEETKVAKRVEWIEDYDEHDDHDLEAPHTPPADEEEAQPVKEDKDTPLFEDIVDDEDELDDDPGAEIRRKRWEMQRGGGDSGKAGQPAKEPRTEEVHEEKEKDDTNSTVHEKLERPLPSPYLPSAWACFMLLSVITVHALFHLMCRWLVPFEAYMLYVPSQRVDESCSVLVRTLPHHGKPGLCRLTRNRTTGKLIITFQRQRFEYIENPSDDADLVGNGTAAIMPVTPPTDNVIQSYFKSKGLKDDDLQRLSVEYGKNTLTITPPSMFTMWKNQMMSPIPVFQLFCTILWMLDEYWQFTMFNLFTIMMLEMGTVVQRLKTLSQLTKMSMKPYEVEVYRNGKWGKLSTQDLLPGDIIQLSVAKGDEKTDKDKDKDKDK